MLKAMHQGIRAAFVALGMIIVLGPSATANDDPADSTTYILPHVTAQPGDLISLPFSINSVHNIGAFGILFDIEAGSLTAEYVTLDGTRSEGLQVFSQATANYGVDAITAIVAFLPPDYIPAGDGAVANLLVTTSSAIPEGSLLPLSFYDEGYPGIENGMSDANGTTFYPDFNHGSILFEVDTAGTFEYSDVNLNGIEYEIADMMLMFEQLEEGITSYINQDAQTRNADVNRDGLPWTIADVLLVRDVLYGDLPPQVGYYDRNVLHLPGDSIWMNGFIGTPTSNIDIPIYCANGLEAGGISFKLNYNPEELGFVSYSLEGSRIPDGWDRISAVERGTGLMFYATNQTHAGAGLDYTITPGSGLLVTLTFEIRNPAHNVEELHFERLQDLGQANGYATLDVPWWNLSSFQQIDRDIYLSFIIGDADGSGYIDIDDVIFLIAYIFQSGPAPSVFEEGDFNRDLSIDIDDVVALIEYIFG